MPSLAAPPSSGRTSALYPGYAALANGTAAHAIELDDTHNAGSIHLGVVMFSTALAHAETLPGLEPGQFFAATVAGYEAAARIAMAVQPKEHYLLGFHPTSTCGVFGAAVTASKILSLTADQMLSAVGIAGSMAAGSIEFLADGAWTKVATLASGSSGSMDRITWRALSIMEAGSILVRSATCMVSSDTYVFWEYGMYISGPSC